MKPGENAAMYSGAQIGAMQREKTDMPVKEDTLCTLDMVTMITKIMHFKSKFGVTLSDKYLRMDYNIPKDLKDKIESTYEKLPAKIEDEEESMRDSTAD